MPAWLLPAAIAALVTGTGANAYAQHQVRSAQKRALKQYERRMRGRTAEATDIWERSMQEQDVGNQLDAVGDLAQDKLDRVSGLQESEAEFYDPMLGGQDRAPTVVKGEIARQLGDELAKARSQIKAQATIEGFSGRTFDRGLQLARSNTDLGNIGLFAQGDRNILEHDQLKAMQAGDSWATVGDILTALGQAGMLAYGAGWNPGSGVFSSGGAAGAAPPNATARLPTIGRVV